MRMPQGVQGVIHNRVDEVVIRYHFRRHLPVRRLTEDFVLTHRYQVFVVDRKARQIYGMPRVATDIVVAHRELARWNEDHLCAVHRVPANGDGRLVATPFRAERLCPGRRCAWGRGFNLFCVGAIGLATTSQYNCSKNSEYLNWFHIEFFRAILRVQNKRGMTFCRPTMGTRMPL
jgi:hypothetical protein